jgi:hypothetical protein
LKVESGCADGTLSRVLHAACSGACHG